MSYLFATSTQPKNTDSDIFFRPASTTDIIGMSQEISGDWLRKEAEKRSPKKENKTASKTNPKKQ